METSQKGFTLVELIVVGGVVATLFGLVTISVTGTQRRATVAGTLQTVLADIKSQQTKAMSGDASGAPSAVDYGVHFDANRYVLFRGSTYISTDTTNSVFPLEQNLQFTAITLTGGDLIFMRGSGEVAGYLVSANSFVLQDTLTGDQKAIQVNRYGVITSIL